MTQEKSINKNETRSFKYNNEDSGVEFSFDIDVSNPETALVEIADFKDLMLESIEDLAKLIDEFSVKVDNEEKEDEGKPEVNKKK